MQHAALFRRILIFCFALFCLAAIAYVLAVPASPTPRIVIISLDGMADWLLDDLLAAGEMPNIRRVLEHGFAADHAVTTFPAKTAVAHAVLWTGTDPSRTGVHANSAVPAPWSEHTLLETERGFSAAVLQAEPIWASAARQGKRAVVVQATQNYPFTYYLGENARFPSPAANLRMYNGYDPRPLPAEVLNEEVGLESADRFANLPSGGEEALFFERSVGETPLIFLFLDDPADPVIGLDTLRICSNYDAASVIAELKPLPPDGESTDAFAMVPVVLEGQHSRAWFRLFALTPDGSSFRLFRSQVHHFHCTDPQEEEPMLVASGGFVGNAGWNLLDRGALGPTLFAGGDGSAERAFAECLRLSTERFAAAMRAAMVKPDWDLLIGYIPYPDDANHQWLGYVAPPVGDPESPRGKAIWPHLLSVYRAVDTYVGTVYDALPDDGLLIIVSDHGYTSFDRLFLPNVLLRQAGLLMLDENGEVDLSRTKAMYYAGGGDFIFINDGRFKGGIVPAADVPAVKAAVIAALSRVTDDNGTPLVSRFIDPASEKDLEMNGPYAGDLYLSLAPGYYAHDDARGDAPVSEKRDPAGNHFGDPRVRQMHSIFLMGGRGRAIDSEIDEMRAIDVAPTIAAMLGIQPPRQATGKHRGEIVEAVRALTGGR